MVERARLERVCTLTRTEGSNPSLSAIFPNAQLLHSASVRCCSQLKQTGFLFLQGFPAQAFIPRKLP